MHCVIFDHGQSNTSLILFSAVFSCLAFVGPGHGTTSTRTSCQNEGPCHVRPKWLAEDYVWVSEDAEDVQVMVVSDEAFEGDTAFALPGGGR